jgi:hypothetical protein
MSKVTHYETGVMGFPNSHNLQIVIDDISTAGSDWSGSMPFDYEIENGFVTLYGAITGTDAVITVEVGGTAVDAFVCTVPVAGSGAGVTTAFVVPSGGVTNEMAEGVALEIITDGASTGVIKAIVNISIRRRA